MAYFGAVVVVLVVVLEAAAVEVPADEPAVRSAFEVVLFLGLTKMVAVEEEEDEPSVRFPVSVLLDLSLTNKFHLLLLKDEVAGAASKSVGFNCFVTLGGGGATSSSLESDTSAIRLMIKPSSVRSPNIALHSQHQK